MEFGKEKKKKFQGPIKGPRVNASLQSWKQLFDQKKGNKMLATWKLFQVSKQLRAH